jgi:hypothetical protein
MINKQWLIDGWVAMIHEGQTRGFFSSEHEVNHLRKMKRLNKQCKVAGFDPYEIHKCAIACLQSEREKWRNEKTESAQ